MDAQEDPDLGAFSGSPLHDDFELGFIRKFEGLWLYEDDFDINYRVEQFFRLFDKARGLFYDAGRVDCFIWSGDATTLQLTGSEDIYVRTHAIFSHEIDGQPDSLTERARQICALGGKDNDGVPEFRDGQIFASLALSEFARALDAICDVCVIFQAEIKPFREPLAIWRELQAPEYWREVHELRKRNWREEREKFISAYEHKARGEMMMLLALLASEGVMPHRVTEFAAKLRREGNEHGYSEAAKKWERKNKQNKMNAVITSLARKWQIFTPAPFYKKLFCAMESGNFICGANGGNISKENDGSGNLRYRPESGPEALITLGGLKKTLTRAKPKK